MVNSLITSQVFIGTNPNDGTGANLRYAFSQTNTNVQNITQYLNNGPTFANTVTVLTNLNSNISNSNIAYIGDLYANTGTFSGTISSSTQIQSPTIIAGSTIANSSVVSGTLQAGDLKVTRNVEIEGNLTVFGNVTTITTSEYIIQHPTIELGGANTLSGTGATLSSNDGKDRGIEFFWYDDITNREKNGFFGYQNSSNKFTIIPDSSSGYLDIFNGNIGSAIFDTVEANIISIGNSSFANTTISSLITENQFVNLSGGIKFPDGSVQLVAGTSPVSISSGITSNVVNTPILNVDTISSYTPGNNIVTVNKDMTIAGNLIVNGVTTTINSVTLTVDDSIIYLASGNPADSQYIGLVAEHTNSILGNVKTGLMRNISSKDYYLFDNYVGNITPTNFNTTLYTANLHLNDLVSTGNVYVGETTVLSSMQALSSDIIPMALVSLPLNAYRSATFTIQAVNSTQFHLTTIMALHDGTTANSVEYGSVDIGGQCATYTVTINGSMMELIATPNSTDNTTFNVGVNANKI